MVAGLNPKTITMLAAALLLFEGWKNVQAITSTSTAMTQVTAYGELVLGALLLFQELK
jgi:hypothetical protein